MRVEVRHDAGAVGERAAELVADAFRAAAAAGSAIDWAISGGMTPLPMFRRLADLDLSWGPIDTWQVDERIAPLGHPDRNLTSQLRTLPEGIRARLHPMPVEARDLDRAAARYAASLPGRFAVVHLGIGGDGHTASLIPGDPVLAEPSNPVAITEPYRGRRRMTLTFPGLARAASIVWVVTGAEKGGAVARLLAGDRSIPAARVPVADQVLVTTADLMPRQRS